MTDTNYLNPTFEELDNDLARTDQGWNAIAAEWKASCEIYNRFHKHKLLSEQYRLLLEVASLKTQAIAQGADYTDALIADIERLDGIRADDALRQAYATSALDRLTDSYQRAEFAALTYRYEHGAWPKRWDLIAFMQSRFNIAHAEQILLRAINEPDCRVSGLFFAPEAWLADAMRFDPGADIAHPDLRCFVSAETQLAHRLHYIYNQFAYESICE